MDLKHSESAVEMTRNTRNSNVQDSFRVVSFDFAFYILSILLVISAVFSMVNAQGAAPSANKPTSVLKSEVRDFMAKEVATHFGAIKSLDPPPDRVNGAITTG